MRHGSGKKIPRRKNKTLRSCLIMSGVGDRRAVSQQPAVCVSVRCDAEVEKKIQDTHNDGDHVCSCRAWVAKIFLFVSLQWASCGAITTANRVQGICGNTVFHPSRSEGPKEHQNFLARWLPTNHCSYKSKRMAGDPHASSFPVDSEMRCCLNTCAQTQHISMNHLCG